MIGTLIIAGIFYLMGALFSGKLIKYQVRIWKALLTSFVIFIFWLWFLHFSYAGDVPQTALSQVSLGCVMLFMGLRSDRFLPDFKKKKSSGRLNGEAKLLFERALKNYNTGNFDEAIEKLLRTNKLQPNNKTILIGLAYNYSRIQDFPKAIDYIEAAVISGYKNFDRIQSHEDFSELRKTELFHEFVENEYKQKHD